MNKKGFLAVLIAVVIIFTFMLGYLLGRQSVSNRQPSIQDTGCTMEAMLCPDGSAVGREGADCEFPECPDQPLTAPPLD